MLFLHTVITSLQKTLLCLQILYQLLTYSIICWRLRQSSILCLHIVKYASSWYNMPPYCIIFLDVVACKLSARIARFHFFACIILYWLFLPTLCRFLSLGRLRRCYLIIMNEKAYNSLPSAYSNQFTKEFREVIICAGNNFYCESTIFST